MKKQILVLSSTLFLLSTFGQYVHAVDITTIVHGGNLSFDKSSESVEESLSGTEYYYGLSLFGEQPIDDNLTLKAGIEYDPILRYTTYTTFEYARDFYTISVGPFFGLFNSWETIMKSGISTSVRVDFPGKVFASFRSDSSIAARFTKAGDYLQEHNEIIFGYYVPHAICSLNLTTKRYVAQQTDDLEVDDSLTEYAYNVNIFQKNVPVRALLSFAYQKLDRIYSISGTKETNTLHSLVLGTDFRIELSPAVTLLTMIDSNIYSFGNAGSKALSLPDGIGMYMFRAGLGMELSL